MIENDEKKLDQQTQDGVKCAEAEAEGHEEICADQELYEFKKTLDELNEELLSEDEEDLEADEPVAEEEPKASNDLAKEVTDSKKQAEENEKVENKPAQEVNKPEKPIETPEQKAQNEKEFKQFKYKKTAGRIDCDLIGIDVSLDEVKNVVSKMQEYCFNSITVLPSRVASLKKEIKNGLNVCVSIGYPYGEMGMKAKISDMREARSLGVKGFEINLSNSLIRDGKKKQISKALAKYRSIAGDKRELKIALDASHLTANELQFAIKLISEKKVDVLLIRNSESVSATQKLSAVKLTAGKCHLQYTDLVKNLAEVNRLFDCGAERILVKNAKQISQTLKFEINSQEL